MAESELFKIKAKVFQLNAAFSKYRVKPIQGAVNGKASFDLDKRKVIIREESPMDEQHGILATVEMAKSYAKKVGLIGEEE